MNVNDPKAVGREYLDAGWVEDKAEVENSWRGEGVEPTAQQQPIFGLERTLWRTRFCLEIWRNVPHVVVAF
jgi:hypothetical protein